MAKQVHIFNMTFEVVFDEDQQTDADMVDMSQLIEAAQKLLNKAKRKPHNHIEIFDHVETTEI